MLRRPGCRRRTHGEPRRGRGSRPTGALVEKALDRARAKAEKKGCTVQGALVVSHAYADGRDQFLVVWPDRVELIRRGKTGSLIGSGAGRQAIPMSRISSVDIKRRGIFTDLEIHTSGDTISFKGDFTLTRCRDVILEQMASGEPPGGPTTPASASVPTESPADIAEALHKLGELRNAGVLTEDEFARKKAELLKRM